MNIRIQELLVLAESGDEDVLLQVESELALMPETRAQLDALEDERAEAYFDTFATASDEPVTDEQLDKLAEEADF